MKYECTYCASERRRESVEKATFWMVWSPQGNQPRVKHMTEAAATAEAKRLARVAPGNSFVVLKAERAFRQEKPEPPPVVEVRLSDISPDEIPF